ncbi:MAG: discoidin domain-containing protein, partial [Calditrichaceae bacterium]|nr:discoidin domain-containing protein [Calditrichaceae bacterium]
MIIIRPAWFAVLCFITGSIFTSSISFAQDYTRGIGIYPGDPKEDFSPEMCVDNSSYRNLALYKAAYHSSCVDYNLTAQLITDGIVDMEMPGWIMASTGKGPLPKNERQWLLDRHVMTSVTLDTCNGWIQFDIKGNAPVPVVDSLSVSGNLLVDDLEPGGWQISVAGSNDGQTWETVLSAAGEQLPGDTLIGPWRRFLPMNMRFYDLAAKLQDSIQYSAYRIRLNCPNAVSWRVSELFLLKDGKRVTIGGPYRFNSAWMSAGHKTEWVYVDLGAVCTFDQIKLFWIRQPSVGKVQVSDDAVNWKDIGDLHADAISIDDIVPDQSVKGRYVRVLMEKPATGDDYVLSEMQVLGRGGPVAVPKPALSLQDKGILNLAGGGWKLNRASEVRADGQNISQTGFNDRKWLTAAVPATILMSYVNAGAVPDPNFGDNQLMISESYFYSDFWYRNVFTAPAEYEGKRVWLNFDGINWKAEVYLNGKKLGRIEGAFTRGKFDVTGILLPGKQNALAVLIEKNDTPGFVKEQTKFSPDANGGEIGGDNPTFHASVGWDWIPTIRGRNTGIWNEVFLSTSDAVTIENPFVSADLPLPDTTSAKINIEVTLQNHTADKTDGVLKVNFGELTIEQPLSLSPAGKKVIVLNPDSHPALLLKNPKLWWPNGYGAPHLHDVKIEFI